MWTVEIAHGGGSGAQVAAQKTCADGAPLPSPHTADSGCTQMPTRPPSPECASKFDVLSGERDITFRRMCFAVPGGCTGAHLGRLSGTAAGNAVTRRKASLSQGFTDGIGTQTAGWGGRVSAHRYSEAVEHSGEGLKMCLFGAGYWRCSWQHGARQLECECDPEHALMDSRPESITWRPLCRNGGRASWAGSQDVPQLPSAARGIDQLGTHPKAPFVSSCRRTAGPQRATRRPPAGRAGELRGAGG